MNRDLSVLITARNELFLPNTIDDVIKNIRGNTDVIVSLDGPGNPPLVEHPQRTMLRILNQPVVIGQRAGINACATASTAKYIMKLDAHCSVDEGFDVKLVAPYESGEIDQNTTTVPRMFNLHCFDWQCSACGERTYQGPKPTKCAKCHKDGPFEMTMIWKPRLSRRTDFARFDRELHFQYWRSYEHRPEATGDIADVMSSVGACWMMPRQRFFDIDGLDERHGSWGQMGTEIACKSWLSGGRQVVNKRTWFTHMFRTQPGWSFPYPNPGVGARVYSQDLWRNGRWPKAKHPLQWIIDKFAPIPDWHEEVAGAPAILTESKMKKGIVYYTDCRPDPRILKACQNQIRKGCNGHQIVSVSLQPIDFGTNYTLDIERGILSMFRQILKGIQMSDADVIFLCEHDVLYHPSHFEFTPPKADRYYYNENNWKVDFTTGQALYYICKQVLGLCAHRGLLLEHYEKRVERVAANGWDRHMGFEPGTHRPPNGVDFNKAEGWVSAYPNIDIRHGKNLTPSRWRQDQFRNQRNCQGWRMEDGVPGWGTTKGQGIFEQMVTHIANGG